jgi:hypothetical protein
MKSPCSKGAKIMNVHEAISRHSTAQHLHLIRFQELDEQREQAIEACILLCKNGEAFSVDPINQITAAIIEHAKHGISPLRQTVSEQMIKDFVGNGG